MWLTGDFYGIISWCRMWEKRLAILSLPRHRVALYSLTRWRPATTLKETNHDPLPWRGKSKLSQLQWNTSPNKIRIWKNSCVKGTQDITLRKRIKKAQVQTKDTKRDRKVAMPLADQNDQTWVVHLPQTWLRPILSRRCRWWGNGWTWWWTPSEDEYRATSATWSTGPIHPSPHPSIPSFYRRSFECRRWRTTTETRTLWITWNFSRPWCTFRGSRMRSHTEPFLPH